MNAGIVLLLSPLLFYSASAAVTFNDGALDLAYTAETVNLNVFGVELRTRTIQPGQYIAFGISATQSMSPSVMLICRYNYDGSLEAVQSVANSKSTPNERNWGVLNAQFSGTPQGSEYVCSFRAPLTIQFAGGNNLNVQQAGIAILARGNIDRGNGLPMYHGPSKRIAGTMSGLTSGFGGGFGYGNGAFTSTPLIGLCFTLPLMLLLARFIH